MHSVARNHFPQYVFRDGVKLLWNPILKKTFADRPEERVRLQLIEYLILEVGFSPSRMSFESPVHLPKDKSASRTDVICFDKDFQSLLLIECKAPEIKLNEKASVQIARYNQKIDAPFMLISNGIEDFWFKVEKESSGILSEIPDTFRAKLDLNTNFDYWCKRGFAGNKSRPETRKWIQKNCELLFNSNNRAPLNHFKFEGNSNELYLANYYRIFGGTSEKKLAVSLTATPSGDTKLNAVLNNKGNNVAILSCSLDLLANRDSSNSVLQNASERSLIDISSKAAFNLTETIPAQFEKLITLME